MQSLEHAEQLARVLHLESDAVILHIVGDFRSVLLRTDLDLGMRPVGAELEGVADQIDQYVAEQRRIPAGGGQGR